MLNTGFTIIVLALAFKVSGAHGFEHNVEFCNGCTNVEKQSRANGWAMRNLEVSDDPQFYHSIDVLKQETKTYEVSVQHIPMPPPHPPAEAPRSRLTNTPSEIGVLADDLYEQFTRLQKETDVVIPTDVVSHPWEFVGCSYCPTRIENFLDSHTNADQFYLTIESIANALGVMSDQVPSSYVLEMEGGGEITVELDIHGDAQIDVTVVEVVDSNGNIVPLSAEGLEGLRIETGSVEDAQSINQWIIDFDFAIPVAPGIVTMEECGPNNDDQPSPCFEN